MRLLEENGDRILRLKGMLHVAGDPQPGGLVGNAGQDADTAQSLSRSA